MPVRGEPRVGWKTYILSKAKTAEAKYRRRNLKIDTIRDARLGRDKIPIPEDFKDVTTEHHVPILRDLAPRAQAFIGSDLPTLKATPKSHKPTDQAAASLIEKWFTAAYQTMTENAPWWLQVTDADPMDAEAFWMVTTRHARWGPVADRGKDEPADDYTERARGVRQQLFPFVARYIPTKTAYPLVETEDGIQEYLEITEREFVDVAEEYGLARVGGKVVKLDQVGAVTESDDVAGTTVKFYEYWNCDHFVYMVEDVVVREEEHEYTGYVPVFHVYFSPTSIEDPEFASDGLADSVVPIQRSINRYLTVQDGWASMASWPIFVAKTVSDEAQPTFRGNAGGIKWKQGQTTYVGMGMDWGPMQLPPVGADLIRLLDFFMDMRRDVTLAPILYGMVTGQISGPAASALIQLAKSRFGPCIIELTAKWNLMARFMLHCVEHVIRVPVPVWGEMPRTRGSKRQAEGWIELGPDDIDGFRNVHHTMPPITKLELLEKSIWLADAEARKLVDKNYVRENGLGIPDPESMDERVWVQNLEESPPWNTLLWQVFSQMIQEKYGPNPELGGAASAGTPEALPIGPGGPGMPMVAGVQQGIAPGMGGPLAQMPARPNGQV